MTDPITIPRALLEQALEVIVANTTGKEDLEGAIRAELAKPARCALCGYQHGHQIGCENNPVDIALAAQAEKLRTELAKPVERVEPITLDQFRAIANRTGTTYRHRSDPEKSSYAFVDGSSLDDFWRKVCEAIQPTPAWHDAPTEPGLWVLDDGTALVLESGTLPKAFDGLRWYGPIPQDGEKS